MTLLKRKWHTLPAPAHGSHNMTLLFDNLRNVLHYMNDEQLHICYYFSFFTALLTVFVLLFWFKVLVKSFVHYLPVENIIWEKKINPAESIPNFTFCLRVMTAFHIFTYQHYKFQTITESIFDDVIYIYIVLH